MTPVVTLILYVVENERLSVGSTVNVLFELELTGSEDILTQVLKLSEDTFIVSVLQVVSDVVVVT